MNKPGVLKRLFQKIDKGLSYIVFFGHPPLKFDWDEWHKKMAKLIEEEERKQLAEVNELIQQARQDTAREIFEEIEKLNKHHRFGFEDGTLLIYAEDFQALKAKYPGNKQNPVGRANI